MKKVLIADDNADFLNILRLSLEGKGYEIKCVTSKRDLFLSIKNFLPDIILLDVFLDKFDGRQICKEITDSLTLKNLPIIIFSANPYSLSHYELYGANDYIDKPISIPLLIEKIENLLRSKKYIEKN